MRLRTAAAMVVLVMLSGGCSGATRTARSSGAAPCPIRRGTLSGNVRRPAGRRSRDVASAPSIWPPRRTTTRRRRTTGGYTIKVPTGRYRLEVELRGGDQLAKQPGQTNVNIGDVDEELDFVIGRVESPRIPELRDPKSQLCVSDLCGFGVYIRSSAAIRSSSGGCVEKNTIQLRVPLIFSRRERLVLRINQVAVGSQAPQRADHPILGQPAARRRDRP